MMAGASDIEWTDVTWNPTRGCTRVSPGCENCYAERLAHRQNYPGGAYEGLTRSTSRGPVWTGVVRLVDDQLEAPLRWRRPRRVFVNSMSDLFHEKLSDAQIEKIFSVMRDAPRHTYQILTKRTQRMAEWSERYTDLIGPHVWLGTSVEDQERVDERIPWLKKSRAEIRFLSCEPLLGPLKMDLAGISWVIVGGESGPRARPMDEAWVRSIQNQCRRDSVAFFFKQWGGVRKKKAGRILDGRTWDEMPVVTPPFHNHNTYDAEHRKATRARTAHEAADTRELFAEASDG